MVPQSDCQTPLHPSTRNMLGPQLLPHGLDLTKDVAAYMQQSFRRKLNGSIDNPIRFPSYWSLEFLGECNLAVEKMVSAYRNKRESFCCFSFLANYFYHKDATVWSIKDYTDYLQEISPRSTGQNECLEAELTDRYPPIHSPCLFQVRPCVIVDSEGHLLVWYLPSILTLKRQVCALFIYFRRRIIQSSCRLRCGIL